MLWVRGANHTCISDDDGHPSDFHVASWRALPSATYSRCHVPAKRASERSIALGRADDKALKSMER